MMKLNSFVGKIIPFVLFLSVGVSSISSEIAGYASEDNMAQDLSGGFLYKNKKFVDREDELKRLKRFVEKRILENPKNPKSYIFLGVLYKQIRHRNRKTIWTHLSRDEYFNGPEFEKYNQLIKKNYIRAVELNESASEEDKLTFRMLRVISSDVLLDAGVAEQAIRLEMSLSHTVPDLSSSYTYNSYGVIYSTYMKVGRYEDALRILDEMQQEFPHKVTEIAGARAKVYRSQNEADRGQESVTQEQSKSTPVAEVKLEPPVQKPEPKTVPVVKPEPVNTPVPEPASNTLWCILAAIIAVLVIGGVVVKRRS